MSGGADSLALAAVVAFFHIRGEVQARAVIVDHGLQEGSAQVAATAAARCAELGLAAQVRPVQVTGQGGPEAAARSARLAALTQAAGPGGRVLLAHTLDDQAETVLLGLGRGSGARSLRGMTERIVLATGADRPTALVRPFLTLRRAETERICRFHGVSWWNDPHNADPSFRRVRVRRELLPLMEDVLAGGVAEALARTADQLHDDDEALTIWADSVGSEPTVGELTRLPAAVSGRVLRRLAIAAGARPGELTAEHIAALRRLCELPAPRRIELPGHVTALVKGHRLSFVTTNVGP